MSSTRTLSFLTLLEHCQLLNSEQLTQLRQHQDALAPDPQLLARQLIQTGWLTPFQVNQLFAGRGETLRLGSYVLLERLGEGGMGQVFKARHGRLDRVVALKLLPQGRLTDPDLLRRFRREIRVLAQLSHPHITLAFDADQVGDKHFLVMEYVPGVDLGQLVARQGPLPVAQACQAVLHAALGLQYAHDQGLVHRDVKPSNLLRAAQGNIVKLLDLGLARLHETLSPPSSQLLAWRRAQGKGSSSMTQTGKVIGTPDYIAPEQARNSHLADSRADLYSLGCTFYYLLTGQVPFPGGSAFEKMCRHQEDLPTPVTALRPEVPPAVSALVHQLLAKDPAERIQTGREVAAVLTPLLRTKRTVRPGQTGTDPHHTTLMEGQRPRTTVAVRGRQPQLLERLAARGTAVAPPQAGSPESTTSTLGRIGWRWWASLALGVGLLAGIAIYLANR